MFETELKFQVPAVQRPALLKAMATGTAVTTRLQAVYADTADRRLATAGLALRLRKEGRVWVQTLKGRGDGFMQRLEHEVRLPAQVGVPTLDAARHRETAVGQKLQALLADGAPLLPVYSTDIRRLHRQVRHAGAVVELAYDRGHIMAGDQRVVVDELELELKRGNNGALVSLAQRWARRFDLWWDVRTKSERGYRLAFDLAQVPATRAGLQPMPADHS
ncbi:MAG: CYTH domain-containing protein, partial [Rubrivivax sp.]|nr:CYTH domain-containing protein [Rubrivivax sp.]